MNLKRLQKIPAKLLQSTNKQCTKQQLKPISSWSSLCVKTKTPTQTMKEANQQNNHTMDPSDNFRFWKPIENPTKPFLPRFKIVSYNILAQDLLMQHLHLYQHSKPICLVWKQRLDLLTKKILAQKPDIVCLQEVQENHLQDLVTEIKSHLPLVCLYKKKTGPKTDGCAILYNKNRFELTSVEDVEFYKPGMQLFDRHNIALIAKFQCKNNPGVSFLVATTHLLFNPKREDVRLAQIMFLLAELDRHSIVQPGKSNRMPIILTGDFNFQAHSAPFKLITTSMLRYEGLGRKSFTKYDTTSSGTYGKCFISPQLKITDNCQHFDCVQSNYKNGTQLNSEDSKLFSTGTLTHGLNLKSVYNHFDGKSYGSIHQFRWVTVDHMFYSTGQGQKLGLKLTSVYMLPMVKDCDQIGYLPNEEHGSDHLMLGAWFQFSFSSDKP